jgi:hypothetical protein
MDFLIGWLGGDARCAMRRLKISPLRGASLSWTVQYAATFTENEGNFTFVAEMYFLLVLRAPLQSCHHFE